MFYNTKKIFILILIYLTIGIESFKYKKAKYAVISNYNLCAKIGLKLLKNGGNGFDAAIGVMLCEGVAKPQDMGLGGGFMGLVKRYKKPTYYINAREIAPIHIGLNSFKHDTSSKIFGKTIGVPSALKGYGYLKKFSKLSWRQICSDVYKLAKNGFPVVIGDVLNKKQYQYFEEMYRNVFINPKTQLPYQNGEIWRRNDLAQTIYNISIHGSELFYSDKYSYKKTIKNEINEFGGVIVDKDFDMVKVRISSPLTSYFIFNNRKIKIETTPLPGGGINVEFILRIMEKYYKDKKNYNPTTEMYYVLAESFKFAFAYRNNFGDPRLKYNNNMKSIINKFRSKYFINSVYKKIINNHKTSNNTKYYYTNSKPHFDKGTANIVIKTPNEIIVLTSSINLRFGSWVMSKYGFIYNNQLSDFSLPSRSDAGHLPASKNNYPQPLKYPVSSMSTTIVSVYIPKLKKYIPRYVIGAAGGPKIITSIAQVLNAVLARKINIVDAIKFPRFHHQLIPNYITMEKTFYKTHKKLFFNYKYKIDPIFMKDDYSAVTGLEIHNSSYLSGTDDPRRKGDALYL